MSKNRRVDLRGILAKPDLRRELMVPTLQATQAREGIETTREHAERAYYVVTEAERATFFDLERFKGGKGQPDRRHEMFARALTNDAERVRFDVARRDFAAIEAAPLAYHRVELVAHLFGEALPLDPGYAAVTSGLMTVQINRIVRFHWEIPPSEHKFMAGWSRFAKGGEFSRFYRDVDLLVDIGPRTLGLLENEGALRNRSLYGSEGLTWVPRTQRGFNIQFLPRGTVFGKKGPLVLPKRASNLWWLLAVLSSGMAEYLLQGLMSFGSYEVGVLQKVPITKPSSDTASRLQEVAKAIHDAKASWDEGNETSTGFRVPWCLQQDLIELPTTIGYRLDHLAEHEATEEARIQTMYAELNHEVYKLYGIPDSTRVIIEDALGARPPEVLWPQMEGRTVEQKRMEHVFRLLSYVVKRVVETDERGIVPFAAIAGEPSLAERVHQELQVLFPELDVGQVEVEIANELRKRVKGYRRTGGIAQWLENAFFEFHCSLYKSRPIFWHIVSSQGTSRFAFGALVHYHRFDKNRMAQLRGQYLRDAFETLRREAAIADKAARTDVRQEWQAQLEEAQELDRRLQWIQEGRNEGPEGGDRDYRILTPWKMPGDRPNGWAPDLDDGVKVNIQPLQKARVLRVAKVV